MQILVSHPTFEVPTTITMDDVWGTLDKATMRRTDKGMIIAHSIPDGEMICPAFGDAVPYKSVTVVCPEEQVDEVCYWLEHAHGGNSIVKMVPYKGKIAIRSNYMCW